MLTFNLFCVIFFLLNLMASFSYNCCVLASAQISQALVLSLTRVHPILVVANRISPIRSSTIS